MSDFERDRDRNRGPQRLGELLPLAARRLGLDDELALAQAMAAWDQVVAERVAAAVGACRLVSIDREVAVIEADAPIVAQELRLRSVELLEALRAALGQTAGLPRPIREVRVAIRHV